MEATIDAAIEKKRDNLSILGFVMLTVSIVLYFVTQPANAGASRDLELFLPCYIVSLLYFFIILFSGRLRRGRNGLPLMWLFLIMLMISAFALNREVTVFEKSVWWLDTLLILSCANILAFNFADGLAPWIRSAMSFVAGISMCLFVYFALYLLPAYGVSCIAIIFFGFSLQAFAPLLFCIYTLVLIKKKGTPAKRYWKPFLFGIGYALIITVVYASMWTWKLDQVKPGNKFEKRAETELPGWIAIAKHIGRDMISDDILNAGVKWSVPQMNGGFPEFNSADVRLHNPLVLISYTLFGGFQIEEEDKEKILASRLDSRYGAQERLWSGKNLTTSRVKTELKIWPEYQIAYTALTFDVFNQRDEREWNRRSREALYTFHLPEGSVATSLSLWIEGKEEKGILTTKQKADSAYRTIVGVEQRDPSLLHWQEGNTISVRVFPVEHKKARRFKIGITSPLAHSDTRLLYNSIHFEGPPADDAETETEISFEGKSSGIIIDDNYQTEGTKKFSKKDRGYSVSEISCDPQKLSSSTFTFNGNNYRIDIPARKKVNFSAENIYLDVNSSWSQDDCESVYDALAGKNVYAVDAADGIVKLNDGNKDAVFKWQRRQEFSLFPFHKIKNRTGSLVISKSKGNSPVFDDLRGSAFSLELGVFFQKHPEIRLFNIGEKLSPYLSFLKESRCFRYEAGPVDLLKHKITTDGFTDLYEDDSTVQLRADGLAIVKSVDSMPGNAPDHLMRLFAYNHILKRLGSSLLLEPEFAKQLTEEAKEAHIVTPVSSLLVLESKKDYDRFDIKAAENSLLNASEKSSGAVPEPHEWALIIVVLLICTVTRFRPKFAKL